MFFHISHHLRSPLFSSPDVKLYDYIKEEVGARMVDRIYDLTKEIKNAAEIGMIQITLRPLATILYLLHS